MTNSLKSIKTFDISSFLSLEATPTVRIIMVSTFSTPRKLQLTSRKYFLRVGRTLILLKTELVPIQCVVPLHRMLRNICVPLLIYLHFIGLENLNRSSFIPSVRLSALSNVMMKRLESYSLVRLLQELSIKVKETNSLMFVFPTRLKIGYSLKYLDTLKSLYLCELSYTDYLENQIRGLSRPSVPHLKMPLPAISQNIPENLKLS